MRQTIVGERAPYPQDEHKQNFSPLIRYVWNFKKELGPTERVMISTCNKALQAIDAHYLENQQDFKYNPEGKLIAFIQSQGGVSGLAETTNPGQLDAPEGDNRASPKQTRAANAKNERATQEILRLALEQIKTSKGIGDLTLEEPTRVGNDGLSVLLARREVNGRLTILGSSNDPILIKAVAATAAKRDLTNVAPSLRVLAEIIATQAYPSHALPSSPEQRAKWYRTKYADKGDLYESDLEGWELDARGRRLTSSKRLLLRGKNREALFSGSIVPVSPVTRCILKEPLIDEGHAVFLRPVERVQVEQWYNSGELVLLRAEAENRFEGPAANSDEKSTYKLAVKNTITEFDQIPPFLRSQVQQCNSLPS